MLNIVFMGTPDFAVESLQAIHKEGHNILAIVTNPDKPKGRGMKLIPSPVKEYAIQNNIKIYQPEKIRNNPDFIEEMKKLPIDVFCVVAYGKILPKEILEIPRLGAINVHGSLLPKYRGAAPIQWAILNGDTETGVTTMFLDEGMDTGDIILKEKVKISENETTGELWEKLSILGGELLVKTLAKLEEGTATRIKQPDDFSMAPMLTKEMAKIDWTKPSREIKNLVRTLNPIIGAYSVLDNKKIKFWKVEIIETENFINIYSNCKTEVTPGTIVFVDSKKGIYVKSVDAIILILEVQPENSKKMSVQDFLRGNKIEIGNIFA